MFCEWCGNSGTVIARAKNTPRVHPYAFKCFCREGDRKQVRWPVWSNVAHLMQFDPELHDESELRPVNPERLRERTGQLLPNIPYSGIDRQDELNNIS